MNQQQQQYHHAPPPRSSSPEYRSVTMASTSSSIPPLMLRSPFESQTYESKQLINPTNNNTTTTTTTTTVPSSTPWTLANPLPVVPAGYMLERNQIHSSAQPAQEIANQISDCLILRSFVITQADGEIKNAFRAESCQGLLFRVNFFFDSSSDFDQGVIVEFQRLAGCSYEFQRTFQVVHRCLNHMPDTTTTSELEFPTCLPVTNNRKERLVDNFAIAMDMIQQSKRLDSQLLGLEVLEPMSTTPEIVPLIFQHIDTLLRFCQCSKTLSELEQQQDCLLKRRALSILANALETSSSTKNNSSSNSNKVFNTLLNNCLHSRDPHQSFQVARCLVSLLISSSNANKEMVQQSQAMNILGEQQQHLHHLALQQEIQKLESILSA